MNEGPIEYRAMSREDRMRPSITHHREVEVVIMVEEDMEDTKVKDKDIDKDK